MRLNSGFTLIELMITLGLGLVMITGVLHLFISLMAADQSNMRMSSRQRQTEALLTILTRDLRRMGFGENEQFRTAFKISEAKKERLSSCITFSYDVNLNGKLDSEEQFGYRLKDQQVQRRRGALNCNDHGWSSLTERSNLIVKTLHFKPVLSSKDAALISVLELAVTFVEPQNPDYAYFYQRQIALNNVR